MNRKQAMRVWAIVAAVAVIVALVAFGQLMPVARAQAETPTPEPPKPTALPPGEVRIEKITSPALEGNLLGDPAERKVYVLLPPGYATSDTRYPVVYVMPYASCEPTLHTADFSTARQFLLSNGQIREMILVVPDGTNTLGGSHFMSSVTIGDYETYVTRDVVNYVDSHYRTLPSGDSRGLVGCANGGDAAMRLALKHPEVFGVVAATDGPWDYSLEVWPSDVEGVTLLKALPKDIKDLYLDELVGWYVQMAAAAAPDPNNPPFYCEMPFRIVNGHGEFVPEVVARIVDNDCAHAARRYVQQPVRLQGIRIQHGVHETKLTPSVHSFVQLLTDLGIEHEYVEVKSMGCGGQWEQASLKYMSEHLVFEEQ